LAGDGTWTVRSGDEWGFEATLVLEDDYAAEFRYSGAPLPALQGLGGGDRVIYVGTLNKAIFPGLRLGYLVAPRGLVEAFAATPWMVDRQPPSLTQATRSARFHRRSNGRSHRHPGDQRRLEEYTESVRDVERRVQRAEEQRELELPLMDQPQGVPAVFEDHLALMFDLQLLAFQSDLTRVISFMISKEQSARPYPQIGVPEAHHPLSHHGDVPELVARMSKINRYHTELFARYLPRLRATPDGDGSLLEHPTILYR